MFTILACVVGSFIGGDAAPLPLIPWPMSVVTGNGEFEITSTTRIFCDQPNDPQARAAAETFAVRARAATGFALPIAVLESTYPVGSILFLSGVRKEALEPDGYYLTASGTQVQLIAHSASGLFYGTQTLLQLLPPEIFAKSVQKDVHWTIPSVTIKDRARFAWRGWMLDVSRHFFTKDEVKAFLDEMALHKLNVFHWHLVDDHGWRIEIKKYPKLTSIGAWRDKIGFGLDAQSSTAYGPDGKYGGFYTQEDIKEIVAYAAARYITIVPEIEMPGHSVAALAAYPEFSCSGGPFDRNVPAGVHAGIYCPGNDAAFGFVEDVLSEVIALFPGRFVHVGGDEVPRDEWKKCAKCQARIAAEKLKDVDELQSYFMKRVEKFLNSKDRRMIGWDEILDGGLAPNAAVMSWRGIEGGQQAAHLGHDVVMSPTSHCYFDHYQAKSGEPLAIGGFLPLETVYSYEPIPPGLNAEEAAHVLGAQGNVWTEYIPNRKQVEYMTWPRAAAMAELTWSPKEARNWNSFKSRVEVDMQRLAVMGSSYRANPPDGLGSAIWLECGTPSKVHIDGLFKGGEIRYTLDGSEPSANSPLYSQTLALGAAPTLVKALFAKPGTSENFHSDSLFVLGSAQVSSTLSASGDNSLARAFDGDPNTFFWTDGAPGEGELLRIHFCAPHKLKHLRVVTGDADKPQDFIHDGVLEISSRETGFLHVAAFKDGIADREFPEELIESVRIRLNKGQDNWVRIHEFVLE